MKIFSEEYDAKFKMILATVICWPSNSELKNPTFSLHITNRSRSVRIDCLFWLTTFTGLLKILLIPSYPTFGLTVLCFTWGIVPFSHLVLSLSFTIANRKRNANIVGLIKVLVLLPYLQCGLLCFQLWIFVVLGCELILDTRRKLKFSNAFMLGKTWNLGSHSLYLNQPTFGTPKNQPKPPQFLPKRWFVLHIVAHQVRLPTLRGNSYLRLLYPVCAMDGDLSRASNQKNASHEARYVTLTTDGPKSKSKLAL